MTLRILSRFGWGMLACGTVLFPAAPSLRAAKIDRHELVTRHNITLTNADPLTPISVGNGEFAFTADITGLQTFPEFHDPGMRLATMSQWGWHSFPNPQNYTLQDVLMDYDSHGRKISYANGPPEGELAQGRGERSKAASEWLRANPHRLDLARIGFVLKKADGSIAQLADLKEVKQTLDLWAGVLESHFILDGQPVRVRTICHPERDLIAVRIESSLLVDQHLAVRIAFPYAAGEWSKAADWGNAEKHSEALSSRKNGLNLECILDRTRYHVAIEGDRVNDLELKGHHEYELHTHTRVMEFVIAFAPEKIKGSLPDFREVRAAAAKHWKKFWQTGGAIDLAGSTDPRWFELERRIVLSQYLTAINSSGSMPPQDTGLVQNSCFGKSQLDTHWWQAAQFALWDRAELLERSLTWYEKIRPAATELARSQGYAGARWPMITDPSGAQAPSSIGAFLVWEEPHPIYYAELLRRAHPDHKTMKRFSPIVFQTAQFMADFVVWDATTKRYVLGPPLIPAQESYRNDRAKILNPTFELAYWQWALTVAQEWRELQGLQRVAKWDEVINHLAKPTVRDGVYAAIEILPFTVPQDHPSLLNAFGVLPKTQLIDVPTMRATLDHVFKTWDWSTAWGWDYPAVAMTAARVGEPERAIDALLLDTPKNRYLANGHNYQSLNLPLYLPGNGGLLYATAFMAAGWDGAPKRNAPGFPEKGWVVRQEGLRVAP